MPEMEMLWRLADAAEVAGDFERARALFEQGAALGDPSCWHSLGYLFDTGRGGEVDKHRAMQCYRKAWRSGHSGSANNIAILYREKGDRRAMFRWFRREAEAGDDGAYLDLAKCYRDGVGVRRSSIDAMRCLAKVVNGRSVSEAEQEEAEELMAAFRPREI